MRRSPSLPSCTPTVRSASAPSPNGPRPVPVDSVLEKLSIPELSLRSRPTRLRSCDRYASAGPRALLDKSTHRRPIPDDVPPSATSVCSSPAGPARRTRCRCLSCCVPPHPEPHGADGSASRIDGTPGPGAVPHRMSGLRSWGLSFAGAGQRHRLIPHDVSRPPWPRIRNSSLRADRSHPPLHPGTYRGSPGA